MMEFLFSPKRVLLEKASFLLRLSLCLAVLGCASGIRAAADDSLPKHLADASSLVTRMDLRNTSYNHGEPWVNWESPESYADCSGFIDELLKHSYGYTRDDLKKWFGSHRPTARRYHDAIAAGNGFEEIHELSQALPGDIIAIKYLKRADNTGHVMIIAERPNMAATQNAIAPQFDQWQIPVIDSSMSGHGPADSRHAQGENGKDHDGLGKGVLCIYTDKDTRVTGFSWSSMAKSEFKAPDDEHVVIGRLKPSFKP